MFAANNRGDCSLVTQCGSAHMHLCTWERLKQEKGELEASLHGDTLSQKTNKQAPSPCALSSSLVKADVAVALETMRF